MEYCEINVTKGFSYLENAPSVRTAHFFLGSARSAQTTTFGKVAKTSQLPEVEQVRSCVTSYATRASMAQLPTVKQVRS